MDAQLKTKWIEALRSKKYRQIQGSLREETSAKRYGYCCLGVLCHTMGAKWKNGDPLLADLSMQHPEEAYLSFEALRIAGLNDDTQRKLARMNDDEKPFVEIADYIETNL